jgi:proteic killer suppression protein
MRYEPFADKETATIYNQYRSRTLPDDIQERALRKLQMLDAAFSLEGLRIPPNNRLEKLTRDRKGDYGIRINKQWRICFRWKNGDMFDVEITDYHKG